MMKGFAHDGPLARALLNVACLFAVSVSVVVCAIPYALFEQLVGWQPTHLAVVFGVVSMLPLGPALFAALSTARAFLLERGGSPGAAFHRFWRAFASGTTSLGWYWGLVALLAVLMAYNVILTGDTAMVLVGAILLAVIAIVFAVALSCAVASGASGRPSALLVVAARSVASRPHVGLAWLLLVVIAYAATLIPLIGPSLAFFTPAVAASGILIVNATFGFDELVSRYAATLSPDSFPVVE
ncbi:hypothetical protein J7E25_16110 [Agromyces sp. ISL-38]|uniref:hypothetical protein n=1 Tax=Agromyces sp. ISL-38 TaxID=2819107 RepID=UPI001BEBA776|nr:hypothetical protein [Agromyces sp. ISL-38]MBT2500622.1 hypothetical protein [Agromyces sp. ISL-38]MBT2516598.1 hypothetical protein [Streptomyces sp. ISL-90]